VLSPIKASAVGVHCLNARLQPLFNPPRSGSQDVRSVLPPSQEEQLQRLGVAPPVWRVGDRVTHLKNDAPADVFNGDQGYIEQVDTDKQLVVVRYPPRGDTDGRSACAGVGWQAQGASSDDSDMYSSSVWGLLSDSDGDEDGGEFHRVTYQVAGIREQLQLAWATTVHKAQGCEYPVVLAALHRCVGHLLQRPLLYTAVSRAQQQLIVVATQQAIDAAIRNQGPNRGAAEASRLRLKMRAAREAAGLPVWERAVFGPQGWE
jgi:exodeoxyribonuclease V alpha subunit